MKNFSVVLLFFSALFSVTASAYQVVSEPTPPQDLATAWGKPLERSCQKPDGTRITMTAYRKETPDSLREVVLFTKDGLLISYYDMERFHGGRAQENYATKFLKAPEGAWLSFDYHHGEERREAASVFEDVIDMTNRELAECLRSTPSVK